MIENLVQITKGSMYYLVRTGNITASGGISITIFMKFGMHQLRVSIRSYMIEMLKVIFN